MIDVEPIAAAMESIDSRLGAIEKRFVYVEGHLADGAKAGDEASRGLQRLGDLYLAIETRLGNIETLLGNYVDATKERTQQARRAEETAQNLISYVRKRFPEAAEG